MKFFYRIIVFLFVSCKLEVNTVDPQSSNNITSAKANNIYIKSYQIDDRGNNFLKLREAWLEHSWKNGATELGKSIIKTSGIQLDFSIEKFRLEDFKEKDYLTNWQMEVKGIGVFGRGNGVYTLYIKSEIVPDSLQIEIRKLINESYITKYTFKTYAKKSD